MTVALVVFDDAESCYRHAADHITRAIDHAGCRRLGVATGATYTPIYRRMMTGNPWWPDLELYLLDDYVGLAPDDPRSFRSTIGRQFAAPAGIPLHRVHGPLGLHPDDAESCREFDTRIDGGGRLDLQLLGIGTNGHIGFNEPGSDSASTTRIVQLASATRAANAASFGAMELVPTHAATQGLATIVRARSLLLVAVGDHKAEALGRALNPAPGNEVPASVIGDHPDVTVVADAAAARTLRRTSIPCVEEIR